MSTPVTEAYVKDGLSVEPLREEERHEWFQPFPSRRRSHTMERPKPDGTYGMDDGKWQQRACRCDETVYHGRASADCSREAVAVVVERSGRKFLCGPHLKGAERRAANDDKRAAAARQQNEAEAEARARLEVTAAVLGIPVPALSWSVGGRRYSTEEAVVRITDLEKVADLIADLLQGQP